MDSFEAYASFVAEHEGAQPAGTAEEQQVLLADACFTSIGRAIGDCLVRLLGEPQEFFLNRVPGDLDVTVTIQAMQNSDHFGFQLLDSFDMSLDWWRKASAEQVNSWMDDTLPILRRNLGWVQRFAEEAGWHIPLNHDYRAYACLDPRPA